jgi:formylglycine-generating enzyme required for sulfatase activity
VTQGQWRGLMGKNPSYFKNCGDSCPVEQVGWEGVQRYLRNLSAKTGKKYRLPSEAEWEYAARAGSDAAYAFGAVVDRSLANFNGASTMPVGSFAANKFGLNDMHGNVWEWVQDCWHDNYVGAPVDAGAWERDCDKTRRVLRGGS